MKTKIISASEKNSLKVLVHALKKNQVIVYPTESSYGLGCLLENTQGRKRIYKIKKRRAGKSLPVIAGNEKIISKYATLTLLDKKLMQKFMPGALSLRVRAKKKVPKEFQKAGIVFRIPSNSFARKLSLKANQPIISTSANISNQPSLYSGKEVIRVLMDKVDWVADAGKLKKRKASTIYDTKTKTIIRKGPVKEKEIVEFLKSFE